MFRPDARQVPLPEVGVGCRAPARAAGRGPFDRLLPVVRLGHHSEQRSRGRLTDPDNLELYTEEMRVLVGCSFSQVIAWRCSSRNPVVSHTIVDADVPAAYVTSCPRCE